MLHSLRQDRYDVQGFDGPVGFDGEGRLLLSGSFQIVPISICRRCIPHASELIDSVSFVAHDLQELHEHI